MSFRIVVWVDGDSCPAAVRDILVRASRKRGVPIRFCSNRPLPLQATDDDLIEMRVVTEETVDEYLLSTLTDRDATSGAGRAPIPLVVTRDIPLAERLVHGGIAVMNDRGRLFVRESVAELRSLRDAAAAIRASGLETMPRRRTFGDREKKAFADALDRFLARA